MGFVEDVRELRQAYFLTENQLIEVSRIISLNNDPKTFSPRLFSILGDACSQVENLLRLNCIQLKLHKRKNEGDFPTYFKKLNKTGVLGRQQIDLLIHNKGFIPFVIPTGKKSPTWWTAYNKTKHDLPKGYEKGNLENTLNAVSAAFSLHCFSEYVHQYGDQVLDNDEWIEYDVISLNTQEEFPKVLESPTGEFIPKSKIFFCLSYPKVALV